VLQKLSKVLSLFSPERTELSVLEVAALLRRPRSTVYRLLSQIEDEEFLDRNDETGRYRLGIRLAGLGELAVRSTSLQRISHAALSMLSLETGETATLLVLSEGSGFAVQHAESTQRVAAKGVLGRHWPLHASAGGKTLLAWLPEKDREALIKRSRKKFTAATITGVDSLRRELQAIRTRGYSTVRGEYMEDLWGVAAPIFNHREELEAAITLGGPASRVTRGMLKVLGPAVVEACKQVSRELGYQGPYPRTTPVSGNGNQSLARKSR
jgi:DNA-binding IclR family transcriptional regulator